MVEGPFLAVCLICPWRGNYTSHSIVMAGHYAMKHAKIAHPEDEGLVAGVIKLKPKMWEHVCKECNNVFLHEKRRRSCPKCGSSRLTVKKKVN